MEDGTDRPFVPPANDRVLLLNASSLYSSIVYFSWSGITDAQQYVLHKYTLMGSETHYQTIVVEGSSFYDVEVYPGTHYRYILETAQNIEGKKIVSDTLSVYTQPLTQNPLACPSATLSGDVFYLPYTETPEHYLTYPDLSILLDSILVKMLPAQANIMFLTDATSSMVEENRVIRKELVKRAGQLSLTHDLAVAYFNREQTKISSLKASASDIDSFFADIDYLDEQHLSAEDYLTPIYTVLEDSKWNSSKESILLVFGDASFIDLGFGFYWKLIDLCQQRGNKTRIYTFTLQHY